MNKNKNLRKKELTDYQLRLYKMKAEMDRDEAEEDLNDVQASMGKLLSAEEKKKEAIKRIKYIEKIMG